MSDPSQWTQKAMREWYGIRVAAPAIQGAQEAVVTKVGTALISMANTPAVSMPVVWFTLPSTYGEGPDFGPAPYQPGSGWVPTKGTPCVVVFVGNGVGRPYIVSFPTAT